MERERVDLRVAIVRSCRSQQRLASLTGIRPARLSQLVNGWVDPTPTERETIAVALGGDFFEPQAPVDAEAEPHAIGA
jgi:DNA-binding transcriptional regulator YdaS (Cro superfamily)